MVTLELFRHTDTKSFPEGAVLFREGEPGDVMHVISEGEVNILVGSILVESAGPGSIVGEMTLIDDNPRSATAIAKTHCKTVAVDRHRFQFLVQQTPYFAIEVMQIMAERLRKTNKLLETK